MQQRLKRMTSSEEEANSTENQRKEDVEDAIKEGVKKQNKRKNANQAEKQHRNLSLRTRRSSESEGDGDWYVFYFV